MKEKEYLIAIPYLPIAAQGRELEYALAGWRKHFKERYHIVVVGEGLQKIKGDDVTCIESKRVADIQGQYRQHLDYVSCFKKVHDAFPESEGFIFVADDCYAVNDFDISDVKFLKMLEPEFKTDPNTANRWRQDKLKTKRILKEEGWPLRNFTTHLPMWFEWDKIEELWNRYDMEHNSLVVEDLYFNIFFPNRVPFKLSKAEDNIKLGVYSREVDGETLRQALRTKIWITNSPEGWTLTLDAVLKEHYKI